MASKSSTTTELESLTPGSSATTGSESPTHNPMVELYAVNVGQGDAFVLKIIDEAGETGVHLIDGGRKWLPPNTKFYENLVTTLTYLKCFKCEETQSEILLELGSTQCEILLELGSIVITHPEVDHCGGINRLLGIEADCKVCKNKDNPCHHSTFYSPIIMTTASRLMKTNRLTKASNLPIIPMEGSLVRHWFQRETSGKMYTGKHANGIKIGRGEWEGDLNQTSILTTVTIPDSKKDYDIVLTGDSTANIIVKTLTLEGKKLGLFKVPHHGSKLSNCFKRAKGEDPEKLKEWITEKNPNENLLQCARFFYLFTADVYLISHGNHEGYKHPHPEVITGIVVAAMLKNVKCRIVVTHTVFRNKIKFEYLEGIGDISNCEFYHFQNETAYVKYNPHDDREQFEGLTKWNFNENYNKEHMEDLQKSLESQGLKIKEKIERGVRPFFEAIIKHDRKIISEEERQSKTSYEYLERITREKSSTELWGEGNNPDLCDKILLALVQALNKTENPRRIIVTSSDKQTSDQFGPHNAPVIHLALNTNESHYHLAVANDEKNEKRTKNDKTKVIKRDYKHMQTKVIERGQCAVCGNELGTEKHITSCTCDCSCNAQAHNTCAGYAKTKSRNRRYICRNCVVCTVCKQTAPLCKVCKQTAPPCIRKQTAPADTPCLRSKPTTRSKIQDYICQWCKKR